MKLYQTLDRVPIVRSYPGKILLVCFLGTHAPLLAFAAYAVLALPLDGAVARLAGLILLATLGGTAVTLLVVRGLLAPIVTAEQALAAYIKEGVRPSLPTTCRDEAGALLAGVQHVVDHLEQTLADLRREAMTDPLTSAGNRRWLEQEAAKVLARAGRTGTPVGIVLFDLDHFKGLNDRFGHAAGDSVLTEVAGAVGALLRPYDLFARTGGEEFCILLPDTSGEEARSVAERVRTKLEAASMAGLAVGAVTASFGVANMGVGSEPLDALMARADAQLYRAKEAGRNRVAGPKKAIVAVAA